MAVDGSSFVGLTQPLAQGFAFSTSQVLLDGGGDVRFRHAGFRSKTFA